MSLWSGIYTRKRNGSDGRVSRTSSGGTKVRKRSSAGVRSLAAVCSLPSTGLISHTGSIYISVSLFQLFPDIRSSIRIVFLNMPVPAPVHCQCQCTEEQKSRRRVDWEIDRKCERSHIDKIQMPGPAQSPARVCQSPDGGGRASGTSGDTGDAGTDI